MTENQTTQDPFLRGYQDYGRGVEVQDNPFATGSDSPGSTAARLWERGWLKGRSDTRLWERGWLKGRSDTLDKGRRYQSTREELDSQPDD